MDLVEKLEKRAKELDHVVRRSCTNGSYNFEAAEDRELLEQAVAYIRPLERLKENARNMANAIIRQHKAKIHV